MHETGQNTTEMVRIHNEPGTKTTEPDLKCIEPDEKPLNRLNNVQNRTKTI